MWWSEKQKRLLNSRVCVCVCVCVCERESVCVCTGMLYIMRTKRPHKYNTSTFLPCGDFCIFSPQEEIAEKSDRMKCFKNLKMAVVLCEG